MATLEDLYEKCVSVIGSAEGKLSVGFLPDGQIEPQSLLQLLAQQKGEVIMLKAQVFAMWTMLRFEANDFDDEKWKDMYELFNKDLDNLKGDYEEKKKEEAKPKLSLAKPSSPIITP